MAITGVIFFGDSIFAGTGASEREYGCAKLVKSALKIPVSLRARNWNTTRDGLDRLEEDVIKQSQLSHVVVLFGNNDAWLVAPGKSKVPLEEFRKNLFEIVKRIKENKQTPLLSNLQLINQQALISQFPEVEDYGKDMKLTGEQIHAQYSNTIEELALESKTRLIDIRSKLKDSPENTVAKDGIHPNDKGHKLIADAILQCLRELDPMMKICDEKMQPH